MNRIYILYDRNRQRMLYIGVQFITIRICVKKKNTIDTNISDFIAAIKILLYIFIDMTTAWQYIWPLLVFSTDIFETIFLCATIFGWRFWLYLLNKWPAYGFDKKLILLYYKPNKEVFMGFYNFITAVIDLTNFCGNPDQFDIMNMNSKL